MHPVKKSPKASAQREAVRRQIPPANESKKGIAQEPFFVDPKANCNPAISVKGGRFPGIKKRPKNIILFRFLFGCYVRCFLMEPFLMHFQTPTLHWIHFSLREGLWSGKGPPVAMGGWGGTLQTAVGARTTHLGALKSGSTPVMCKDSSPRGLYSAGARGGAAMDMQLSSPPAVCCIR